MTAKQFAILLKGWRQQTLTPEQTREFVTAINSMEFDQLIDDTLEGHLDAGDLRRELATDAIEQSLSLFLERIKTDSKPAAHRVHFLRTAWFRYAAAVILLFGVGSVLYFWNYAKNNQPLTSIKPVSNEKTDVLPGSDRAMLTLADGKQIRLDSSANAILAEKGITNHDALIAYSEKGEVNVMNTLATPQGGQYKIKLSDGTMVWLNAASSITYPTNFTATTREVNITGEAYFEVAKNMKQPFIVKTAREEIKVLGTEFNVNTYADEPYAKTSLVNGSVKVGAHILRPGQGIIGGRVVQTNIEQDVAWKKGVFDFNNLNGEQAMRQLARWYAVDIKYEGNIEGVKFGGELDRSLTLNDVLAGLEGIGGLHFRLAGKVVIVSK